MSASGQHIPIQQDSVCCAPARPETNSRAEPTTIGVEAAPGRPRSGRGPAKGMMLVPGGEFLMGTDDREGYPSDGEGPIRRVLLDPFFIDACAVTNAQFAQFVKAANYKTEAEAFGWSFVFHSLVPPKAAATVNKAVLEAPWWWPVTGACWRRPEGPGTSVVKRPNHPVVHVSWNDAAAYCQWAGKRLPTEAEWECAARGGLVQKRYPWGDELTPDGKHHSNIWQGRFPEHNTAEDGHVAAAPARSFPPNGYGLYNMTGNVWEWCADWFSPSPLPRHSREGGKPGRGQAVKSGLPDQPGAVENPKGPSSGTSRSMRGGSYLCHSSYCNRYRVAARSSNTPDSSTGNLGFRCVRDV